LHSDAMLRRRLRNLAQYAGRAYGYSVRYIRRRRAARHSAGPTRKHSFHAWPTAPGLVPASLTVGRTGTVPAPKILRCQSQNPLFSFYRLHTNRPASPPTLRSNGHPSPQYLTPIHPPSARRCDNGVCRPLHYSSAPPPSRYLSSAIDRCCCCCCCCCATDRERALGEEGNDGNPDNTTPVLGRLRTRFWVSGCACLARQLQQSDSREHPTSATPATRMAW
jgi:hypothetical protein